MSRRSRQDAEHGGRLEDQSFQKRAKTNHNIGDSDTTPAAEVLIAEQVSIDDRVQPKSRKELRNEKKAAKKSSTSLNISPQSAALKEEDQRMEQIRLDKKEKEDLAVKEQVKEQRKEKKLKNVKKLRREMNAPGGANAKVQQQKEEKKSSQETDGDMGVFNKVKELLVVKEQRKEKKLQKEKKLRKEEKAKGGDMNVFKNLFNGSTDDATGTTTLRLGVKYNDITVGTGNMVQDRAMVTVKYKLTAGKFGATLDSSKKFSFRFAMGEVIQGWEIGMEGMRQGGKRRLIVPPKAGYGSQDIGAGSGAILYFDITLLSC
jgi:FK506-binding nuclear protein